MENNFDLTKPRYSEQILEKVSSSPDMICDWRTKQQMIQHKKYP